MGCFFKLITMLLLACTVHAGQLVRAHDTTTYLHNKRKVLYNHTAIHPTVDPARQKNPSSLPNMIIQWGVPRTATTLQFQTLCLIMTLKHPEKTTCSFVQEKTTATEKSRLYSMIKHAKNSIIVLKTHDEKLMKTLRKKGRAAGRDVWLFATADNKTAGSDGNVLDWQPTTAKLSKRLHTPVKYAQVLSLLSARGKSILKDYKPIFQLSDEETDHMMAYMSQWDILRQCCGAQMSDDWREFLVRSHGKRRQDAGVCGSKNLADLDEVEKRLTRLPVYKRFALKGPVQLRKASGLDHAFSGSYCSWFQRQVRCQKLEFNKLPQKPYC